MILAIIEPHYILIWQIDLDFNVTSFKMDDFNSLELTLK